jgi:hypothetical protein
MKKVKWFDASSGIENTAENIADYLTNTYKLENG